MMPIDFRTHIIEWKKSMHPPAIDRGLTQDEWLVLRMVPKQYRFIYGEEIRDGVFFMAYRRASINGFKCLSASKIEIEREKLKQYRPPRTREEQIKINRERHQKQYLKNRESVLRRTSEYQRKNREKARERQYAWKKRNPDKMKQYYRTAHQSSMSRPERRIIRLLRSRIKTAVRGKVLYGRNSDYESVDFLVWLSKRQNLELSNRYEIDHLVPLIKCNLSTEQAQKWANSPENVRWLTREENSKKRSQYPARSEIDAHLALVAEWRKEKAS